MRQTTLFLVVAFATGILLLPGYQDVISILNFRMSNRPNGPSVIQFPSGASDVYAVFNYTHASNSEVRVSDVFNAFGSTIFDLSRTYNGAGADSIQIAG